MADLTMLRELLQAAENMDPATVLARINAIRSDKEVLFIASALQTALVKQSTLFQVFEQSGTWMMSRVATTLIADIESLCGYGAFKHRTFVGK